MSRSPLSIPPRVVEAPRRSGNLTLRPVFFCGFVISHQPGDVQISLFYLKCWSLIEKVKVLTCRWRFYVIPAFLRKTCKQFLSSLKTKQSVLVWREDTESVIWWKKNLKKSSIRKPERCFLVPSSLDMLKSLPEYWVREQQIFLASVLGTISYSIYVYNVRIHTIICSFLCWITKRKTKSNTNI